MRIHLYMDPHFFMDICNPYYPLENLLQLEDTSKYTTALHF